LFEEPFSKEKFNLLLQIILFRVLLPLFSINNSIKCFCDAKFILQNKSSNFFNLSKQEDRGTHLKNILADHRSERRPISVSAVWQRNQFRNRLKLMERTASKKIFIRAFFSAASRSVSKKVSACRIIALQ